ncbi:unnamed protein product [Allacma fusca]|uniref:Uncharacterized protein n=1 Tax=Allacma fusca TaxID=39272 RepID=A0A8J2JZI4_9HEXA|nr:unnamed protein product [Allacma fusca]
MDSGENANDVIRLPEYGHNLLLFLNDEHMQFSKQDWFQLNSQTREFFETQGIDLTNARIRKQICDIICHQFPKIDKYGAL